MTDLIPLHQPEGVRAILNTICEGDGQLACVRNGIKLWLEGQSIETVSEVWDVAQAVYMDKHQALSVLSAQAGKEGPVEENAEMSHE